MAVGDGDLARVRKLLPSAAAELQVRILVAAILERRTEVIRFLLEADVPVTLESRRGDIWYCPIHVATAYNNPEALALLLKAGADPNTKCMCKHFQLHCATSRTVARLLLEAAADVTVATLWQCSIAWRFEALLTSIVRFLTPS